MGAVMVITSSSLTLTKTIVDVQRESTHQAAFDEYLNRLFLDLPTDAKILLEVNNDGNLTLEIENPGTEFPAGTQQQLAETLWLSESRDRNGLTSLKLETSTAKEGDSNTREPITFSANLLTSLSSLRWELFHKPATNGVRNGPTPWAVLPMLDSSTPCPATQKNIHSSSGSQHAGTRE